MVRQPLTIEYLLTDESFVQAYLEKDVKALEQWQQFEAAHPEYQEVISHARQWISSIHAVGEQQDMEVQLGKLKTLIHGEAVQGRRPVLSPQGRLWVWGLSSAAIILLIIGVYSLFHTGESVSYTIVAAEGGQVKQVTLSDGTQVWLNAGSSIRYAADDYTTDRTVELEEGEAYFKVVHDAVHPFQVKTRHGLKARDIGTSFSVKSYQVLDQEEIRVMEGVVAVNKGGKVLGELHSLQGLSVNTHTGRQEQLTVASNETDWINGHIVLNDVSLRELAVVLEKNYKVQIQFGKAELTACRASVNFARSDGLHQVLDALQLVYGITYSIRNNTVILSGTGCH